MQPWGKGNFTTKKCRLTIRRDHFKKGIKQMPGEQVCSGVLATATQNRASKFTIHLAGIIHILWPNHWGDCPALEVSRINWQATVGDEEQFQNTKTILGLWIFLAMFRLRMDRNLSSVVYILLPDWREQIEGGGSLVVTSTVIREGRSSGSYTSWI